MLLGGVLGLLGGPGSAWGSGQDLFGFGARAAGLGGAASAVDGFEAVYHNPAALADERGRQLAVGVMGSRPALSVDGVERPAPDEEAVLLGVVLPLPLLGPWRDRLGLALGVRLPTDVVVAAKVPILGTPHLGLLEQRARTVGVHFGAGLRLNDWAAVGGGVLALAALEGRIEVRPTSEGSLTSTVDNELLADYAPIVGATLGPWGAGAWRFAAVWRGESVAGFDVPLDADLGQSACIAGLCLGIPEMDIAGIAQYDPAAVRADARWDAADRWLVTAGATWRRWSAFPGAIRPPVPQSPNHGTPAFMDRIAPSAAVQWTASEAVRVRASAGFEPSPVPEDVRPSGLLDADRVTAAVGAGVGWGALFVDGFVGIHLLVERTQTAPTGELEVTGRILVGGLQVGAAL